MVRSARSLVAKRLARDVAICGSLAIVAVIGASCGGGSGAQPPSSYATVWLCRPATAGDPCAYNPQATAIGPGGSTGVGTLSSIQPPAAAAKFDCFYVYPTVSTESGTNADLAVQINEVDAAIAQASQFSNVCNVWAPMYRQTTVSSIESGLSGLSSLQPSFAIAYQSLLSAWKDFLAHDSHGRPFVLIGHSQGSALLIHLIATQIDPNPTLRRRMVVAIIPGGNMLVAPGKTAGGDFANVPLCTAASETTCAIAYSSFPKQPPLDSLFGRAGKGASLIRPGPSNSRSDQVACVNPASLAGGSAELSPYFPTGAVLKPPLSTPWVTYPQLYSAACQTADGASWLQVTDVAPPGDRRPVVSETEGPMWGYHADDINLTLGNLVRDVAGAEDAWSAANPVP